MENGGFSKSGRGRLQSIFQGPREVTKQPGSSTGRMCECMCGGKYTYMFYMFSVEQTTLLSFLSFVFFSFFHALTHCPNTYSIHRPQVELNPAQVRAMSSRPHLLRCSVSAANGVRQCWDSTPGTSIEDASVPNHALTKGHVPFLFFS